MTLLLATTKTMSGIHRNPFKNTEKKNHRFVSQFPFPISDLTLNKSLLSVQTIAIIVSNFIFGQCICNQNYIYNACSFLVIQTDRGQFGLPETTECHQEAWKLASETERNHRSGLQIAITISYIQILFLNVADLCMQILISEDHRENQSQFIASELIKEPVYRRNRLVLSYFR